MNGFIVIFVKRVGILRVDVYRWQNRKVQLRKRTKRTPLWLGKDDLSGKTILLCAEGGFGDTMQFIRYAKLFNTNVKLIIHGQR